MIISEQEIRSVEKLSAQKRYEYFIKKVSDTEEVWGLYDDGWAISEKENGELFFPVWAFSEYALNCATDDWRAYNPEMIPLNEFMEILIPKLQHDNIKICIFMTRDNFGVTPSYEMLLDDLKAELTLYE